MLRLQRRLRELEEELARERGGRRAPRARIEAMSAEVTDTNPYRCGPAGEGGLGRVGLLRGEAAAVVGGGWSRWVCGSVTASAVLGV